MPPKEKDIIEFLKNELEAKYNVNNRETWTHQDFLNLSGLIQEKSGIPISVSTLKRLYGKITSESVPRHSSLDAICVYLGYKNWYDFQQKKGTKPLKLYKPRKILYPILKIILLVIIISSGGYFIKDIIYNPVKSNLEKDFVFATADTFGIIPHSVILKIDITNLKGNNFWIKHPERKANILLNNKDTVINFFLRDFGFKSIALYQKNTKLKETQIRTGTDGWIGLVSMKEESENKVTYNSTELYNNGVLTIPEEEFKNNIKLLNFDEVRYVYANKTPYNLDRFKLETRWRYKKTDGYDICERSYFIISGTKGYISFPFGNKSCLKGLVVFIDDKRYPAINNPEHFSYKHNEWLDIKIIKNNEKIEVYKNKHLIISDTCKKNWGTFFLTKYQFIGNGEIDYFRLYDERDSLMLDFDFDEPTIE